MKLIVIWLVVVMVGAASPRASAETKVVLESYTGARPADAARLSPLLDALANRGFVGGYEVLGRQYETRVSRPALASLPANFAQQVEDGHKAWATGKFDDAVKILTPLVTAVHASSGAFADNKVQDGRDVLLKAYVVLGLSQQRRGDPEAMKATFAEALRSFPSATLSKATYGPEAVDTFEKAKRELAGRGRGTLRVGSTSEAAVIYINERIEGPGPVTKENLLPGEYRVFARLGKQLSRTHRVTVTANETANVAIDLAFDAVVRTSPWTGLEYGSDADRQAENAHVTRFASALGADAVAVVGIETHRGHPAIVGALINRATGEDIRRAYVPLDPAPSETQLAALAAYITGENLNPPPPIEVAKERRAPVVGTGTPAGGGPRGDGSRDVDDVPRSGRWGGWKFLTGAGALVGIGAGVALVALDGKCQGGEPVTPPCMELYKTATPGYVALGGGAVLAAVTVYLFVTQDRAPARTAYVVPTSGGAVAGFAMRF